VAEIFLFDFLFCGKYGLANAKIKQERAHKRRKRINKCFSFFTDRFSFSIFFKNKIEEK
tara:strand:+ start:221 stop:397 length:177 start_codon:yes stop_codon:yes gene_type:complete